MCRAVVETKADHNSSDNRFLSRGRDYNCHSSLKVEDRLWDSLKAPEKKNLRIRDSKSGENVLPMNADLKGAINAQRKARIIFQRAEKSAGKRWNADNPLSDGTGGCASEDGAAFPFLTNKRSSLPNYNRQGGI
jgi:hypothetical protein